MRLSLQRCPQTRVSHRASSLNSREMRKPVNGASQVLITVVISKPHLTGTLPREQVLVGLANVLEEVMVVPTCWAGTPIRRRTEVSCAADLFLQ